MKMFLPALVLAFSPAAFADVIFNINIATSGLAMSVTDEDAVALKSVLMDYEGQLDSVIRSGIKESFDSSSLRSITCIENECYFTLAGHEALRSVDTQSYYTEALNSKLRGLKKDEVLITSSMGRGSDLTKASMDSRLLRLLMEKSTSNKNITVTSFKPSSLKNPDQLSSKLYEVTLRSKNMTIKCSSSIVTGMSNVNILEESCSFAAKAKVM